MPPPTRKLGGHKNPTSDTSEQTKTIFDNVTPPVSPEKDSRWKGGPSTPDPEPVSPAVASGSPAAVPEGETGTAPLHRFAHRPDNPRWKSEYDPTEDEDLKAFGVTVDNFGVMQALTVCTVEAWLQHHPGDRDEIPADVWWVIIMGNRRFAIAKHKKLRKLSFVRNDSVSDVVRAKKAGLIENRHRTGVDPLLEAQEMRDIIQEEEGTTHRSLADELGMSHGQVWQRLQLLRLIKGFQLMVSARDMTVQKALPIAKLSADDQQTLLDLGAPYSPDRLRKKGDNEPASDPLSTREQVRIPKRSTPTDVVQVLADRLSTEMLTEVSRLLAERATGEAAA